MAAVLRAARGTNPAVHARGGGCEKGRFSGRCMSHCFRRNNQARSDDNAHGCVEVRERTGAAAGTVGRSDEATAALARRSRSSSSTLRIGLDLRGGTAIRRTVRGGGIRARKGLSGERVWRGRGTSIATRAQVLATIEESSASLDVTGARKKPSYVSMKQPRSTAVASTVSSTQSASVLTTPPPTETRDSITR